MSCQASNTVVDVPDSPRSSTELYGYYHTDHADKRSTHDVILAISAAHAQLRALLPGLQTRLLQRAPGDVLSKITWMEIFSHPQGLSEAMIALILSTMAALPAQRLGPRVTERFVTVV
ncbi:hypothetical protein [Leptothrix ochracea]|uniref:hypothetical protein n=1 Tax=Leptothrix ochracea TaxID=735331 RepID=UPI0034E24574